MSDAAGEGSITKERHSGRRTRNRKNIFGYNGIANQRSFHATDRYATQQRKGRRSLCSLSDVI